MKPIIIKNQKKLGYKTNSIITPRNEKSISQYFSEINNLDLTILTRDQETELFQKIEQGDENAKNKVVLANLKFVISVAKNYINQGLPFEDLINEGNIGLIKSVEKFKRERGFKFISYAVWWIRQSILEALVLKGKTVRIPINKKESLIKVQKVISQLEQKLQRKPTNDEIVEFVQDINIINNKADIDTDDITSILLSNITATSLDEPIYGKNGDEDGSLYDIIPAEGISYTPKMELIENEIKDLLRSSGLTEQERCIIELSFGVLRDKRYNLEEIGELYGLSRERVRQIKEKGIRKLRNNPKIKILFEYAIES